MAVTTRKGAPGSRVGTSIEFVVWQLWRFGWQIIHAFKLTVLSTRRERRQVGYI